VTLYPARRGDVRKGDFGHVLVVGGSPGVSGCLVLNAMAALRAGCDLATVAAPAPAAERVLSHAPDLMALPFESDHPDAAAVRLVLDKRDRFDAAVLGSGAPRTHPAFRGLRRLVERLNVPHVHDAEAIRAVAEDPDVLAGTRALLTPHAGEFEIIAGEKVAGKTLAARKDAVRRAALRLGVAVVLKGALDVVSDGRRVHVDRRGSPYMTKGGWGDLLAGAAGGLLARGASPFDAGVGAAALVGVAGERSARRFGESLLAADALAEFPAAVRTLARDQKRKA
jgi:hydroxyethylthiazole kinase-like uncharacterized protein yjeF